MKDQQPLEKKSELDDLKKTTKSYDLRIKMERNLQSLFLFYSKQIPSVTGIYIKKTLETAVAEMNLNMFMVMCRQFNILGHSNRIPNDQNKLEKKKRGVITQIQAEKKFRSSQVSPLKCDQIYDYQEYKDAIKEQLRQQYKEQPSRHQWWTQEKEFDKYYHPIIYSSEQPENGKYLDYRKLMITFKKQSYPKSNIDYEGLKRILAIVAQELYDDDVKTAVNKLYLQVFTLHKTKKMLANMKPLHHAFNIAEEVGFREFPKLEQPKTSKQMITKINYDLGIMHSSKVVLPEKQQSLIKSGLINKYFERASQVDNDERSSTQLISKKLYGSLLSTQIRSLKQQTSEQ